MIKNFVIAALCMLSSISSASLYSDNHSEVQVFTHINFDKQVGKNREKGISVVHFYKKSDGRSPDFAD